MLLFKYNLYFLLFISLTSQALSAGFVGRECLDSGFKTEVKHKGQPFGLAENILGLEKKGCLVKINHEKMRFLKEYWEIDVCRGPIHIKSGTGAVDVARRSAECSRTDDSAFCQELRVIESVLQNDGLIFAQGAKEDLGKPHGMVYCTYLLLQKYLRDGVILSAENSAQKIDLGSGFFEEDPKPTSHRPSAKTPIDEKAEEVFPETQELGEF